MKLKEPTWKDTLRENGIGDDELTPQQLADLERAIGCGCSHEEACAFAHATMIQLMDYVSQRGHEGWEERCRRLFLEQRAVRRMAKAELNA